MKYTLGVSLGILLFIFLIPARNNSINTFDVPEIFIRIPISKKSDVEKLIAMGLMVELNIIEKY